MSYGFERDDKLSWSVYSRVYLVQDTDLNEIVAALVIGYDRNENIYYITPAGHSVVSKLNDKDIVLPTLTYEEEKEILCDFFDNLQFMEPADLIDTGYYTLGMAAMEKNNFYFYASSVGVSMSNEIYMTHSDSDSDWNELFDEGILIPYKFDFVELDNIYNYCGTDCLDFDIEVLKEYVSASEELGLATFFEINFDYLYE